MLLLAHGPLALALTMARSHGTPWQRYARRGTTEQRGYGTAHRRERERRLLLYRPGDICAHCGQPMSWWPLDIARDFIDLPHTADRSGYMPGLAHRSCNRADGARRRNLMYGRTRQWQAARRW